MHWDQCDLDLASAKENAAPEPHQPSDFSLHKAPLDVADWKFRGQYRRTPLAAETFIAPELLNRAADDTTTTTTDLDALGGHDLVRAARQLDPDDNIFERHRKQQFQWVLSFPASAGPNLDQPVNSAEDLDASRCPGQADRRYFGCNLLTWTKPPGKGDQPPGDPDDRYLLLATPIDLKPDQQTTNNIEFTTHQFRILRQETKNIDMAAPPVTMTPTSAGGSSTYRPSPLSAQSAAWSTAAEASEDSDNTLTIEPHREMKAPLSTIEDSLEEMDQLEEALAAITEQTQGEERDSRRSPASAKKPMPQQTTAAKKASSVVPPASRAPGPVRSGRTAASRSSTVRNSLSSSESTQDAERTPTKAPATPRKVARPASLAPPKPIQKANKAPTLPTFELPGERVARELKEKKAARLSMQLEPQKNVEPSPPQRSRSVRSSKPPTVPNFELPGERISRMKQERLAKKREEEERAALERRQFKARPPPSSVTPTVRSTFTSRQRQSQMGAPEQDGPFSPAAESSPKAGASKRQSVTMSPTVARTVSIASASTVSSSVRGRTSSIGSSHVSTRATSSSAGSVASGGKRATVSTQEIQQQKVRGREIYTRDNSWGQNKEQQELERKEAIKLARQKYAELSRKSAVQGRNRRSQQFSGSSEDSAANVGGA